ncbi:MAG: S8 family serine peptidase [Deinococcaceae bacterium]
MSVLGKAKVCVLATCALWMVGCAPVGDKDKFPLSKVEVDPQYSAANPRLYAVTVKESLSTSGLAQLQKSISEFPATAIRQSFFDGRIWVLSSTPESVARIAKDPQIGSIEDMTGVKFFLPEDVGGPVPQVLPIPATLSSAVLPPPWSAWNLSGEYTYGSQALGADIVHREHREESLGAKVGVCVLDTGLDITHPDLKDINLKAYKDFAEGRPPMDPGGHGTHVVGTIAAQLRNGSSRRATEIGPDGVVGIAPRVNLYFARVFPSTVEDGAAWTDLLAAINWCDQQLLRTTSEGLEARMVMNLSLGSIYPRTSFFDAYEYAFRQFTTHGGLVVSAAGNNGISIGSKAFSFPASFASVVAVSSLGETGARSPFSNFGDKIELAAPGENIFSTVPQDGQYMYGSLSVTGMPPFQGIVPARNSIIGTVKDTDIMPADGIKLTGGWPGTLCDAPQTRLYRMIALISAFDCRLQTKVDNAVKSGALGVLVMIGSDYINPLKYTGGTSPIPVALIRFTPGVNLLYALPKKGTLSVLGPTDYAPFSGTSMAAPHVTGAAALVWSQRPSLNPLQLRQLLRRTATDIGAVGKDDIYGYGIVNPFAALEEISPIK